MNDQPTKREAKLAIPTQCEECGERLGRHQVLDLGLYLCSPGCANQRRERAAIEHAERRRATHTPGPWTPTTFGTVWGGPVGEDIVAQMIATQADVNLIAAAPELHAALREAIQGLKCFVHGTTPGASCSDCDCWSCETVRQANAALEKAEGR